VSRYLFYSTLGIGTFPIMAVKTPEFSALPGEQVISASKSADAGLWQRTSALYSFQGGCQKQHPYTQK
jgi:hypothetical protein